MSSYDYGKDDVCKYIRDTFPKGSTCLDVGACDGKWFNYLGDYLKIDAVEIWTPNILKHDLESKYHRVFNKDIADLEYEWYDLIIFGDVIEHMSVEKAQQVLNYAKTRCKDMIIGVPFLYKQGTLYGNPYERHIQPDLTPEIFDERYKGYRVLCQPTGDYCYYHKPPYSYLIDHRP